MSLSVEQMLDIGRVQAIAIAPNAAHVVVEIARLDRDRTKFVPHLYRISLQDGSMTQLTRGPHGCRAPRFRGDGSLTFLSTRSVAPYFDRDPDAGDNERNQVWLLPEEGEAFPLTDLPLGVISHRVEGILRPRNIVAWYETIARFFERTMR
jgi:dipeptidyl aminopeptidase/acylaminoacyl peptidase